MLEGLRRRMDGWRAAMARVRDAYAAVHGRPPDLMRPRRFTEKMQWRKLFDHDRRYAVLCDKLRVRDVIARLAGPEFVVPVLWSGEAEDIPFHRLQPPYVLKSNHASGQVVVVREHPADEAELRAQAAAWLRLDYGLRWDEPGYARIPGRLLAEALIVDAAGRAPEEVRMFVFDGRVAVANTVLNEDGVLRNGAFHTRDWTRLDWHFNRRVDRPFPPPRRLADMVAAAERLGAGLEHARVDFYDCGDRLLISEITFYSWGGHSRFQPDEADFILGAHWRLRAPRLRAWATMLRRPANHPAGVGV